MTCHDPRLEGAEVWLCEAVWSQTGVKWSKFGRSSAQQLEELCVKVPLMRQTCREALETDCGLTPTDLPMRGGRRKRSTGDREAWFGEPASSDDVNEDSFQKGAGRWCFNQSARWSGL